MLPNLDDEGMKEESVLAESVDSLNISNLDLNEDGKKIIKSSLKNPSPKPQNLHGSNETVNGSYRRPRRGSQIQKPNSLINKKTDAHDKSCLD